MCVNAARESTRLKLMKEGLAIQPGSVGFFQPHDGKSLNLLETVDPYALTPAEKVALVGKIKNILEVMLFPDTLFNNLAYKDSILNRVSAVAKECSEAPWEIAVSLGSWLHFDEILAQKKLKELHIQPCAAHYPFIVEAAKGIEFLAVCHFSSVVFIAGLHIPQK